MKHGIDVSRHQGDIDWQRVAPHVDEVLIRATMGAVGVDDRYAENWREAGWAGIKAKSFYHLATSGTPWRGQRDNIARVTRGDFGAIAVVIDAERTAFDKERQANGWRFPKEQYTDDVLALADWLKGEAAGGVRIYSNKSEIEAMTTQTPLLAAFGFHGAGYPLSTPMTFEKLELLQRTYRLAIPRPWTHADAWQGASTGRLPGIAGNVDMSLIYDDAPVATPARAVAGYAAAILDMVSDALPG